MAKLKTLGPFEAELKIDQGATDEFPHGFIEGYASVFNNEDLGGDTVRPGAFTRTLKDGIPKNRIKLVDSHNYHQGTKAIIGTVPQAKEDKVGVAFKGRLSSVQHAQDVRTKVKEGILDAMSFGYNTVRSAPGKKEGTRDLLEVKVFEFSVVPWGMNPEAGITRVKGMLDFSELPVAPIATAWSEEATRKSLLTLIGGDPSDWKVADWTKYAKAFLWCDPAKPNDVESYQLPVAAVVDGELSYVKSAVVATETALLEGGDWDDDDQRTMEAELKKISAMFTETDEDLEVKNLLVQLVKDAEEYKAELAFKDFLDSIKA